MKKILISISLGGMFLFMGLSASAQTMQEYRQCNQTSMTPIQCGYYLEGLQDGRMDSQSNRKSDYKRYRNKLDGRKYETFYRQGYDEGFSQTHTAQRWTVEERRAYDNGYGDGENDRRRNISRLPERYDGQFNRAYQAFYRQGYYDGYDNRIRQYDTVFGSRQPNPTFPTPINPGFPNFPTNQGTPTGTISWRGRVDNQVNIVIKGNQIRNETISGIGVSRVSQTMNGVLPSRQSVVSVRKRDGRGVANVIQQPNRSNNYTAIIQVSDEKGGSDDYRLDISWQSIAQVEEPYQSGKVVWKGKVDQTVNIIISGTLVQTQDVSATGVSNVTFNISGYLARRPGAVSVRKDKGRGTVTILQQPSEYNDYVAVIQIFDADRSDGDYQLEITW